MFQQVALLVTSNFIWFAEQVCGGIEGDIQGPD